MEIINNKENSIAPKIGELNTYRKKTSALTRIIINKIDSADKIPQNFMIFFNASKILKNKIADQES